MEFFRYGTNRTGFEKIWALKYGKDDKINIEIKLIKLIVIYFILINDRKLTLTGEFFEIMSDFELGYNMSMFQKVIFQCNVWS